MQDLARAMLMYRDVSEPRLVDADTGAAIDSIAFPLGKVCGDLEGRTAILAVRERAVVVDRLEPEGDPAFRALPNAAIESLLRQAYRTVATLGMGGGSFRDAAERRVSAENMLLYPPVMDELRIPADQAAALQRNGRLIATACAAMAATVALVVLGLAHPIVILLVPGLALWSLHHARAIRLQGLVMEHAPFYQEHLRRAHAQARSIASAATRARGLSH